MALTKEQKGIILDEVTKELEGASTVYLTNCSGLTVEHMNTLRTKFRASNIQYRVVKNTLLRLAMDRVGGFQEVYSTLEGPTAIAYCNEPAAPARVIKEFSAGPGAGRPELKAAFVDGAVYDGKSIDILASLRSKQEIIGDIAGLLLAPMTNVVGALQAQGGNLVGALQTMAEREG